MKKPLIVGVDQIVRGKEAEKIIQKIANNPPPVDEDSEFLVFRIKVLNPSQKAVNPLAIKVKVIENATSDYAGMLDLLQLDLKEDYDLLFKSDYKKLNTASTYEAGETKYGTYVFAAKKGSTLKKYTVIWEEGYAEKSESADLTPQKLKLLDPTAFLYLYFFALSLLAILYAYLQRKRNKSDGYAKSLMLPNIFWFGMMIVFIITGVLVVTIGDALYPSLYLRILLVLTIVTIIYYFYVKSRYVILFSFVNEKDISYIQEEFVKRMGWTNVGTEKCKDHVEVTNKDTWETYHFYKDYVKKEDVVDSLAMAKETLREIYLSLPIDRMEVFNSLVFTFGWTLWLILVGI